MTCSIRIKKWCLRTCSWQYRPRPRCSCRTRSPIRRCRWRAPAPCGRPSPPRRGRPRHCGASARSCPALEWASVYMCGVNRPLELGTTFLPRISNLGGPHVIKTQRDRLVCSQSRHIHSRIVPQNTVIVSVQNARDIVDSIAESILQATYFD